jgi:tripartite ATP-independent transporter DctP family solute receptor
MNSRRMGKLLIMPLLLSVGGCLALEDQTVIKLGHALDTSHPVHQAMAFMADRVAELSDGTMRIDIYPSQQLCSERECMELLQIGSLGMTKVSTAAMENFVPSFQVLNLPYLFRDEEHQYRVLESELGREMLAEGEPRRLLGLTYYDAGSRSFYTKDRPIETPGDLAGKKIRVMESATSMRMVRALGGSPTPIAWGELYTALQQGVVDGAENNPPSFYTSRHYEVARYYSLDEHTTIPDVVVVSTVIWNTLTPQEQQWLRQAAEESAVLQRELWRESSAEALRAVEAAGVTIIRPDKEPFAAQVTEMLEAYRSQPELYSLIQQIRAME